MGIIYLLQTREFINKSIYKIGHSEKDGTCRTNQYPKQSILHLLLTCNNHAIIESKIIYDFKSKYIHKQEIGNEYFEGDLNQMIMDIILIYQKNECNKIVQINNNSILNNIHINDVNIENKNILLSLYGNEAQFKMINLNNNIKNFEKELYYFDTNTIKINKDVLDYYLGYRDKSVIEVIKINNKIYCNIFIRFFLPRKIFIYETEKKYTYISFFNDHPVGYLFDNTIQLPNKENLFKMNLLSGKQNPWISKKDYDIYIIGCRKLLRWINPNKYTCMNGHKIMSFFYDFINLTNIYDVEYHEEEVCFIDNTIF